MTTPSRRALPAVHIVLTHPALRDVHQKYGHEATLASVRTILEQTREAIVRGEPIEIDPESLARRAAILITSARPTLRKVLNATGILLHTGLGRAPLAAEAIEAVAAVAGGYCNLELDLETAERGRRTTGVADLLRELTGAEAATVVNNNAGATILALRALAIGREVIVSRGQLVEIGGSFRLPEIFEVSGARLREVGTTNRTRIGDYARAIGPETAVLLRVHPSNYRVVGFTESVSITELTALGKAHGLAVIDDIGSGAIAPGIPPGISGEPTVLEGIAAGADLVLCSGDKVFGGPQCGLIIGSRSAVAKVEADPLMRALRVDKMTLAALEATLRLALDPKWGAYRIPVWKFLTNPLTDLEHRAEQIAETFRSELELEVEVVDTIAYMGAGSQPGEAIASKGIRVTGPWQSESAWAQSLRVGDPPVVTRVQGGSVVFDLRTIDPDEDNLLLAAVRKNARRGCDGPVGPLS